MRVGRFIRRLIAPETDQIEDRPRVVVPEIRESSSVAGENDDQPRDEAEAGSFASEEELRAAGIDPDALYANEDWGKVTPLKPDADADSDEEAILPESEVTPTTESEAEPEAESKPELKVDTEFEPQPPPASEPEDAPGAKRGPEPEPDSEPDLETESDKIAPLTPGQRSDAGDDGQVEINSDSEDDKPTQAATELPSDAPSETDETTLAQSAIDSGFIITLAHELRTPIASLRVSYDLLKDPETVRGKPSESKRLLGNIDRSIARLERQASDLLEVGYLRSGSLSLVRQPLDLTESLLVAVDSSRAAAAQRQISIELELEPEQPLVLADGYRLTQVMTQLLSNAIKFTPVNGSVLITVKPGFSSSISTETGPDDENVQPIGDAQPDVLIVRVIDRGPGIRTAHFGLIFEPFYRISGEGIGGGAGVGLGLSIVKGLVELNDGKTWVKSTPGDVTEFGFSIPLA